MVDKSRVIIIKHPSFEGGGAEGISEAKKFGELFLMLFSDPSMRQAMHEIVSPENRPKLDEYIRQFKVLVRKIPNDQL